LHLGGTFAQEALLVAKALIQSASYPRSASPSRHRPIACVAATGISRSRNEWAGVRGSTPTWPDGSLPFLARIPSSQRSLLLWSLWPCPKDKLATLRL